MSPLMDRTTAVRMLVLLGFWIMLTEQVRSVEIAVGLGVAFLVAHLSRPVGLRPSERLAICPNLWRICTLIAIYLKEMVAANLQIARLVLQMRPCISPGFVRVPLRMRTPVARTLFGNTVTLTPGTLTVDVGEESLLVHALTADAARDVMHAPLGDLLVEMEARGHD